MFTPTVDAHDLAHWHSKGEVKDGCERRTMPDEVDVDTTEAVGSHLSSGHGSAKE